MVAARTQQLAPALARRPHGVHECATASLPRPHGVSTVLVQLYTASMGSAAFGSPSNRGHGFADGDKIPSLNFEHNPSTLVR